MTLGTAVVAAFALLLLDVFVWLARGGIDCNPCDVPTEIAGALVVPLALVAAALVLALVLTPRSRR